MSIAGFYERVSRAIRRGRVYDEDIPGYAADAVRELEDLQNWKYMEDELVLGLAASSTEITTALIGAALGEIAPYKTIKSVRHLAIRDTNNDEIPLRKRRREEIANAISSGRPGAYWTKSDTQIGLDATTDQTYSFVVIVYRYSGRPLGDSLAWLNIAEDLLIARTIRKMQPILRDDKLVQRWQQIEASKLPALEEALVVQEYDGQVNRVVPFADEVEEFDSIGADFT